MSNSPNSPLQAEFRELYVDLRGSPQINLNFSPSPDTPSATGYSSSPGDPLRFNRGSPSGRPFGGPIRFASPLLSAPIRSSVEFTGYSSEGILRSNNFADVPDGKKGITNILTNAFGVEYTYEDIAIVNNISTTSFNRSRAYVRLYDDQTTKNYRIVQKDAEKTLESGIAPDAVPLQTISNQSAQIDAFLGSPSTLHAGDGLVGRFYSWSNLYGNSADDLVSTGGGTYVENQNADDNPQYASPNNYVQAEPSEIFFSFSENELLNVEPVEVTKEWNNGFFNFGRGGLHPTFTNKAGVVQYKGYYNTGIPIFEKSTGANGLGFDERLYIVENNGAIDEDQTDLARTTVPVIWKFWKLDANGDRINSDPDIFARYAPKFEDTNSPAYKFTSAADSRVSINDKLHQDNAFDTTSDCPSNILTANHGTSYIIAPRVDDTPRAPLPSIIPFSQNEYYETELYFILAPRVGERIGKKTVMLCRHDDVNNALKPLPPWRFHSQNPLKQSNRGEAKLFYENKIPKHGSQSDLSPNAHINAFGEATIIGAGNGGGTNYRSLVSNTRIRSLYKPPVNWTDIYKGQGNAQGRMFQNQVDFGNVFTTVYSDDRNGGLTDFGVTEGNLVIDAHSTPNNGVFDTFTYVDKIMRNRDIHLSKSTIRLKNRSTVKANHTGTSVNVIPKYVDHVGLKGYGFGLIRAAAGLGPQDEDLCYMSPQFYYGESPSVRDVVIPMDYTDTKWIQVFDTNGSPVISQKNASGYPNIPLNRITNGVVTQDIPQNSPDGSLGVAYPTYHGPTGHFRQTASEASNDHYNLIPSGEFFFVYHSKGLIDKSMDGMGKDTPTSRPLIQALVDVEIGPTTGAAPEHSSPAIDRSLLFDYNGNLIKNAERQREEGGLLGLFADYNGSSAPNSSVVRKVLDGRLPSTFSCSGFAPTDRNTPSQIYELDQIGCAPTTAAEKTFTDQAAYNLSVGSLFYRGKTNKDFRIIYNSPNWDLVGPNATGGATVRGRISSTAPADLRKARYSFPSAGSGGTNFTSYPDGTTAGKIANYTDPTAAEKNRYTLILNDPNSGDVGEGQGVYDAQALTQTLKVGFGITIGKSTDGSAPFTKSGDPTIGYQVFPPTDTAPPFRATDTGLRTIPEDAKNKVFIEYASPNAGTNVNDVITSITFTRLKFTGDFGDTPANVTNLDCPEGVGQTIALADGPNDNFNRKIKFNYKNPNGTIQTFSILATTDSTA